MLLDPCTPTASHNPPFPAVIPEPEAKLEGNTLGGRGLFIETDMLCPFEGGLVTDSDFGLYQLGGWRETNSTIERVGGQLFNTTYNYDYTVCAAIDQFSTSVRDNQYVDRCWHPGNRLLKPWSWDGRTDHRPDPQDPAWYDENARNPASSIYRLMFSDRWEFTPVPPPVEVLPAVQQPDFALWAPSSPKWEDWTSKWYTTQQFARTGKWLSDIRHAAPPNLWTPSNPVDGPPILSRCDRSNWMEGSTDFRSFHGNSLVRQSPALGGHPLYGPNYAPLSPDSPYFSPANSMLSGRDYMGVQTGFTTEGGDYADASYESTRWDPYHILQGFQPVNSQYPDLHANLKNFWDQHSKPHDSMFENACDDAPSVAMGDGFGHVPPSGNAPPGDLLLDHLDEPYWQFSPETGGVRAGQKEWSDARSTTGLSVLANRSKHDRFFVAGNLRGKWINPAFVLNYWGNEELRPDFYRAMAQNNRTSAQWKWRHVTRSPSYRTLNGELTPLEPAAPDPPADRQYKAMKWQSDLWYKHFQLLPMYPSVYNPPSSNWISEKLVTRTPFLYLTDTPIWVNKVAPAVVTRSPECKQQLKPLSDNPLDIHRTFQSDPADPVCDQRQPFYSPAPWISFNFSTGVATPQFNKELWSAKGTENYQTPKDTAWRHRAGLRIESPLFLNEPGGRPAPYMDEYNLYLGLDPTPTPRPEPSTFLNPDWFGPATGWPSWNPSWGARLTEVNNKGICWNRVCVGQPPAFYGGIIEAPQGGFLMGNIEKEVPAYAPSQRDLRAVTRGPAGVEWHRQWTESSGWIPAAPPSKDFPGASVTPNRVFVHPVWYETLLNDRSLKLPDQEILTPIGTGTNANGRGGRAEGDREYQQSAGGIDTQAAAEDQCEEVAVAIVMGVVASILLFFVGLCGGVLGNRFYSRSSRLDDTTCSSDWCALFLPCPVLCAMVNRLALLLS